MINANIITIQGNWNYGNRLQNFAVARISENLGFRPVSLILMDGECVLNRLKAVAKKALGRTQGDPELMMSPSRRAAFLRFNRRMSFKRVSSAKRLNLCGGLFFVGSDQVWSTSNRAKMDDWFFLQAVSPERKIALAPSIGLDSLGPANRERLANGISSFPVLSVREQRGAELIKECSGRDAQVVCDPTLVVAPVEWRAVADDGLTPFGPYVLTYLLGGIGSEAAEVLESVTDHGCIPVVPLSDRQKPGEPDAGPAEFISLIDNAAHVVTDSFHAAVFSSILQTSLTIVHREGGASMFSRLETLSAALGIQEKIFGSPAFDLSRAGDYEGVPEAIGRERKKFMDYLEGCLDEQVLNWRDTARA